MKSKSFQLNVRKVLAAVNKLSKAVVVVAECLQAPPPGLTAQCMLIALDLEYS